MNLYEPEIALMIVPDLLEGLTILGLKLQRSGFEARVPGVLVWIHTLRACRYLEIRYAVKQMWQLVEKGFPWADAGAESMKEITGFEMRYDRPLRVPSGFSME